nr:AAA family ATPase [uncultured Dethiosulfovibrio sp.]
MIKSLSLRNFTNFESIDIDFSPKVNVFIGENSTGKTHLLKAAYTLCHGASTLKKGEKDVAEDLEKELTKKLLRIFMPLDDHLGNMYRQGANPWGALSAKLGKEGTIDCSFSEVSRYLEIEQDRYPGSTGEPSFIPTKEVLSFMKGFTSLYEKYDLSFDQTYYDLCLALDLPEARREYLHEKVRWAMGEIRALCGGSFVFYGGGKVTFKAESGEHSANSMAEGFRKAGVLYRLMETGSVQPGQSGPLFWDEPEANLNPRLIRLLVQILLELSREGQQIILATHDYVFIKWLDLIMNKEEGDQVRYHVLSRDDSGEVSVQMVDDYGAIPPNAIANAFSDMTKEQVRRKMGTLGK